MLRYEMVVEGVFIYAPELGQGVGGFYTTFFLSANNAANARHLARRLLIDRMASHGVVLCAGAVTKSIFYVHDLWEISADRFDRFNGVESGFSFFKIGWGSRISIYLKAFFLHGFWPERVFKFNAGSK